ncbi:MAG TPA: hypothetical protein VJN71_08855 [Nitrososphaerales archaeon]|nr:hypothetical protein [Nitrososphaerales archaeon]
MFSIVGHASIAAVGSGNLGAIVALVLSIGTAGIVMILLHVKK